ncbi:MAG TPA: GLUG motif-containing protein [Rhizomicrobium sp.]|nr:GLUG motif-containing protein [Rhizomicrobium sp.]
MRKRLAIAGALACLASSANAAVTISSDTTTNMDCSAGVCAPTESKAVLNVTDLEDLLGSGGVQVTTTGAGGVQAKDITVAAAISWSNQNGLSLDAHRSITINRPISIAGAAGLSLATAGRGTLSFGAKGDVTFASLSSVLTINGTVYTLENSISALASAIASNPAGSYALANSYDASQDGPYSDSPIATQLVGVVQGLGNTISNLSINRPNAKQTVGLFTEVASTGSVADLRLHGLNIMATKTAVGGLVGYNQGTLSADEVQGSISAKGSGGGLVGDNRGTITGSAANVRVKGTGGLGGLVGSNAGTISLSHASGDVNGSAAGGLVGDNDNGSITQSYATGTVEGGNPGGLVGKLESSGSISDSYSTGGDNGGRIRVPIRVDFGFFK